MTDQASSLSARAAEAAVAVKFGAVGLIGLAVDALLLHAGLGLGLSAAAARAVSLICAMQVTFAINGLKVFHCLTRAKLIGQWFGYMAANGLGNLANYWLFVALISLHWGLLSNPVTALLIASFTAYLLNFAGTRVLVFGKARSIGDRAGAVVLRPGAPGGSAAKVRRREPRAP